MVKVPFTPQGFKDLEVQLYALDDHALQAEANAVLADYVDWATGHIELTAEQIAYLQGLDTTFIASLAANAAIAFINRLPLNLLHPESDGHSPQRGKWFLDRSTIAASDSPGKTVQATGELIYEFEL